MSNTVDVYFLFKITGSIDSLMYLPKHYNFDKYVLISKDTVNERTWGL